MKEDFEDLCPGDYPPRIYYKVIPVPNNVSTRRVKFTLTATGIEGVASSGVTLKDIPVTILLVNDIPSQPMISQVAIH